MDGHSSEQDGPAVKKGGPFDNLSRDDLVKKCKGLLGIAQKAKQAKDEYQEENRLLKEELQNFETQKHADKEGLKAMQEMVEALTQNKLMTATQINDLQNTIVKLERRIKELDQNTDVNQNLSIENESLRRQIKRLTDENDDLLKDFEVLERKFEDASKVSLDQQKGLLILEKSSEKLENENKRLAEEHTMLTKEIETLNAKKLKYEDRFQTFKSKIMEFSQKLKQLKASRQILVEIVQDYSQTVPKWQNEISTLSSNIFEKILFYEKENKELQNRLRELEENSSHGEDFDNLKTTIEKMSQERECREIEIKKIEEENQKLKTILEADGRESSKVIEELNEIISSRENKIKELTASVEQLSQESVNTTASRDNKIIEIEEKFKTQISQNENKIDELYTEISIRDEQITKLSDDIKNQKQSYETAENLKLREAIQDLYDLKGEFERQSTSLEEKSTEVISLKHNLTYATTKLDEISAITDLITTEFQNKNEKIENLTKELEQNRRHLSDDDNKLVEQTEKNARIEYLENCLGNTINKLDKISEVANQLQKEVIQRDNELEALQHNLENETSNNKELSNNIIEIENNLRQKELNLQEIGEKLTLAEQNLHTNKITEDDEKHLEIVKLTRNIENLNMVLLEKESEIEVLKHECDRKSQELKTFGEVLQENDHIIKERNAAIEKLSKEHENLVEQFTEIHTNLSEKEIQLRNTIESLRLTEANLAADHEKTVDAQMNFKIQQSLTTSLLEKTSQYDQLLEEIEEIKLKDKKEEIQTTKLLQDIETISETLKENEQLSKQYVNRITELESNLNEIQGQLQEAIENLRLSKENLNNKTEELTEKTTEIDKYAKDYENLNTTVKELESTLAEKENLLVEFKNAEKNVTSSKDEIIQELSSLKSEINMKNGKIEKLAKEIENLTTIQKQFQTTVDENETQLQTAIANLKMAKTENQDLLAEMKEINQIMKERGGIISKQQSKISEMETSLNELQDRLKKLEIDVNDKEAALIEQQKETENYRAMVDEKVRIVQELTEELQQHVAARSTADRMNTSMADSQSEILSTSTISRADEVHRMREIEDSFEEKYHKLRALAVKLKKKVTEQTTQIANLESERKSNGDSEKFKAELDTLQQKFEVNEVSLKKALETEKTIRAELEKTRAAAKKSNVLSLEMDAYEKSLNEVTQKLEKKKSEVQELELAIDALNVTNRTLKEQLKLFKDNLETEKTQSLSLQQQIDVLQTQVKDIETTKSDLVAKNDQISREFENLKLAMDDEKIKQSGDLCEKEKLCNTLIAEKEKLLCEIYAHEENFEKLRSEMKLKEEELENLRTEFTAYKIRAQSVLRQNQSRDSGREKELEEEVVTLNQQIEMFREAITKSERTREKLERELNELKSDKETVQKRCADLMALLEESRLHSETVLEDARKQNSEHQEIMKTQRIQIDTLNTCYKNQIKEIEEKHKKDINQLRDQLNSNSQANTVILTSTGITDDGVAVHRPTTIDEKKLQMFLLEREEGEGSESIQSSSQQILSQHPLRKISTNRRGGSVGHEIIPLEDLLNNPFEEHVIEERAESPTQELKTTKDKLVMQESRAKHLTTLLAEAEQDLARLNQLNDVLKEEVRRQQRSMEREQHIHNSEYIKNVIFKFLTLNSGDEKSHLVPVLNTILKLSPDETHKLQAMAKGEGSGGWLGKLPIWSNNN